MYCKNQKHDHSKIPVVVATENPSEPRGRRPFHCPECFQVKRKDANKLNWTTFTNVAQAKVDKRRACKNCFPYQFQNQYRCVR